MGAEVALSFAFMVDQQKPVPGPEMHPSQEAHAADPSVPAHIQGHQEDVHMAAEGMLSPQPKLSPEEELARRREAKELSQHPADLNVVSRINEAGKPLNRGHLERGGLPRALVLTKDELAVLGHVDYVDSEGNPQSIEYDDLPEGQTFILFPENLGYVKEEESEEDIPGTGEN